MPPDYGYSEEGESRAWADAALWQRILAYSGRFRWALVPALALALTVSAANLLMPRLMQRGIDGYILASALPEAARIQGLGRIVLAYGGLMLLVFACTFAQMVLLEWMGQSVMHRMRQELFEHLLGLDLGFFHRRPTGRLVTRLTNDIQNMHEMFTSVLVVLCNEALMLLGIFLFLFLMNARLALAMLLFAPVALGSTWFFSRIARDCFRDLRLRLSAINAYLAEHLGGIGVLQAFGAEERSRARFEALSRDYMAAGFRQIRLFGIFVPFTEMLGSVAIAVIVWHGGGEVLRDRLTIGELAAFLTYMRLFFRPLRELSQNYSIVQSAMASAERIFETLDERAEILPETPGGAGAGDCPGAAEFAVAYKNITFGYRPDQPVLSGIDLAVRPGETVALVGATGAGKSSLVSLLVRFYDPQEGGVYVNGRDIRHMPLAELRGKLGLVMQDIFILPDTVRANIILDRPPDEARLDDILSRTGLHRFIARLPRGLDTQIGEGALNLSLGEKQLLSFVRALYRDPEILILDEATASIDTASETLLEEALEAAFADRAVLVIAHRLSTIRRADRIVLLDQGRILESGRHEELMAKPGSRYRDLVEIDLQR